MTGSTGDAAPSGSPGAGGPAAAAGAVASSARVVLTTVADEESAERLVTALLDEGLIACGTIVPGALSLYRWQGAVQREREALLLLKTTDAALARLLERVPALHPYDVPELLALRVEAGHRPYLDWLDGSVGILRERD